MAINNRKTFWRSLAFKMILLIFLAIAAILVLILTYNYKITKNIVVTNLKTEANKITENTVLKIDKVLSNIQSIPMNYSPLILSELGNEEKMKYLLRQMVENNKDIFGAALAFEPYYKSPRDKYYSFYYCKEHEKLKFVYLGNDNYNYFTMDWYQIPRELGRSQWCEPYFDEGGGNALMSTYSIPLYVNKDGRKTFIGILTVDVSLTYLQQIVNAIKVYQTGYGYMISRIGTIVTHKRKSEIMNESIFSIADNKNLPQLRDIGRKMIAGKTGFEEIPYMNLLTGKLSWMAYAPVPANGWSVAVIFPVDEFMADENKLYRSLVELAVVGLALIFLVIFLISRSITGSLRRLTEAAEKFAEGDFNVTLPPIRSKDEIGRLNNSFIYMQETLAKTIHDLKKTSEELRISHEQLEEYNKTLEQKVDERTAQLRSKNDELDAAFNRLKAAQAQLVQSEKMASLGALTAGIAHEIKNPLNFINNFSELSVELVQEILAESDKLTSALGEKEADYIKGILQDIEGNVQKIHDHGKRADSIIRGMLLHSRGKSGERQPTDVNALLAEYVNLGYHGMRATDSSFNIKIESDYDKNMPQLNVIPQDLSRVFLNMINNACYSTNQKKQEFKDAYFPVLKISTKDLGDKAEFRIWDNGKGIPKAVIEKVFNPFYTTKPAGKGTGLGLSISFDIIVQEHQGKIEVDSKEGEYAEFVITIPKTVL
ncbi:MAG: ATP-binding protein [Bacteroidota bacterium]|jgi:signal transduction histidine kinase